MGKYYAVTDWFLLGPIKKVWGELTDVASSGATIPRIVKHLCVYGSETGHAQYIPCTGIGLLILLLGGL